MADDLGYPDLSCRGRRDYRTPVLDALAAEGMGFTHFYANSASARRRGVTRGRSRIACRDRRAAARCSGSIRRTPRCLRSFLQEQLSPPRLSASGASGRWRAATPKAGAMAAGAHRLFSPDFACWPSAARNFSLPAPARPGLAAVAARHRAALALETQRRPAGEPIARRAATPSRRTSWPVATPSRAEAPGEAKGRGPSRARACLVPNCVTSAASRPASGSPLDGKGPLD